MTTLVLLHPFPLSGEVYRADAGALSERMRVLTPSVRGFGGAPPFDAATPPSIDAMADDVAAYLDRNGVDEPVVLGGISMGGYVSLAFARRHPARLRALVLADTRAEPDSAEAKDGRDAAIARIEGGDLAGFVDGLVEKLVGPERRDEVRALAMEQPPSAVCDALRALRDRPDARPGLAAINVPTLIVVGEGDVITPPAASRAMAGAITGAEIVVIPGAAHLANLDRPAEFRDAIASFVARV